MRSFPNLRQRAYHGLRERWLARRVSLYGEETAPDGFPLPPPILIVKTTGLARSQGWYLASGEHDIEMIEGLLGEAGRSIDELGTVLDFGCGCGRVARRWAGRGPRVLGCDLNPEMVEWCNRNLPFMDARSNGPSPPAPFEGDSIDFIYAFSVFTHLPATLQEPWLAELRRLLAPGGLLLFSTLGRSYAAEHLDDPALERFEAGELMVVDPEMVGDYCMAYASQRWVEETLGTVDLELVAHQPAPEGRPPGLQDTYLARRPDPARDR